MEILKQIKTEVEKTLKIARIEGVVIVTQTLIEVTVETLQEAKKLERALSNSFDEVEIYDLAEIGEPGYMVDARL